MGTRRRACPVGGTVGTETERVRVVLSVVIIGFSARDRYRVVLDKLYTVRFLPVGNGYIDPSESWGPRGFSCSMHDGGGAARGQAYVPAGKFRYVI